MWDRFAAPQVKVKFLHDYRGIMEIPSKRVFEILKDKGVEHIHHANSVITTCQFLRNGALISRGSIDRYGMFQTAQKSDQLDKNYGIWFDIFTDSVDIHDRAKRANVYGPVLLELDLALIKDAYCVFRRFRTLIPF